MKTDWRDETVFENAPQNIVCVLCYYKWIVKQDGKRVSVRERENRASEIGHWRQINEKANVFFSLSIISHNQTSRSSGGESRVGFFWKSVPFVTQSGDLSVTICPHDVCKTNNGWSRRQAACLLWPSSRAVCTETVLQSKDGGKKGNKINQGILDTLL